MKIMATKWGIITAGKISHDFVCCLRSLPSEEHQVIAIAARNVERAEEFAKYHNIPKAYGTYEELAKDKEIEVVYVGTINPYHLPVGKMLLEAGKHVLMEKPMGMNLQQTKELIAIAKKQNRFLMEAVWSRFLPAYNKLMEELKNDVVGDVYYVTSCFGVPLDNIDRVSKKNLGGGTILDLGIYTVNAISMVYEGLKPKKIVAVGQLNSDGVDENMAASLLYENGKLANISTSSKCNYYCEIVISGTKGTIRVLHPMWCPTTIITPTGKYDFPLPETVAPCNFTNSSGLRYEAEEVRRCLKEGLLESPKMTHADSELFAEIMDEIKAQLNVNYNV